MLFRSPVICTLRLYAMYGCSKRVLSWCLAFLVVQLIAETVLAGIAVALMKRMSWILSSVRRFGTSFICLASCTPPGAISRLFPERAYQLALGILDTPHCLRKRSRLLVGHKIIRHRKEGVLRPASHDHPSAGLGSLLRWGVSCSHRQYGDLGCWKSTC